MPRIRYLKPEFFTDEDLGDLAFETRLTFAGLWCHADRAGRLEDRPRYLKAMIFPYDDIDIEAQLKILACPKHNGTCFIQRYQVDGKALIQIVNWEKHQKPHHTEAASKYPPPESPPAPPSILEKGTIMEKGMGSVLNPSTELKNGDTTVKEPLKIKYKEYVLLTEEEHERLKSDFGEEKLACMIECLDNYIGAAPKKRNRYTDHNRVLRGWVLDKIEEKESKNHGKREPERFAEKHYTGSDLESLSWNKDS